MSFADEPGELQVSSRGRTGSRIPVSTEARALSFSAHRPGATGGGALHSGRGNSSGSAASAVKLAAATSTSLSPEALSTSSSVALNDDPDITAVAADEGHRRLNTVEPPAITAPSFSWGSLSGTEFASIINAAYTETVHWRRNLFKVPSGKEGKAFVAEMARLYRSYAETSALESVALKAAMTMPHLLLQKPSAKSNAKEHCQVLGRRLRAWSAGEIDGLMQEGRVIQRYLTPKQNQLNGDRLASLFSRLMLAGKTRAAIRLLSKEGQGSVLPLDQLSDTSDPQSGTVLDALKSKHPPPGPVNDEALISSSEPALESHEVIFLGVTGDSIRRAALRCGGSSGPSGLDAHAWQRICTSFKGSSTELCNALALLAQRISTQHVSPEGLSAFTACRLIALDKCPGIRPIGVAEVPRRIVGKAVLAVVSPDVQKAAGAVQLCAGQEGGCEAAIHAMRMIFQDASSEGVLLVDASNAFNRLNRKVALHNISRLCPSLATILMNTYRGDASLFVDGETLHSREGTTQGDPLAMAFYALAPIPLIKTCKIEKLTGEVWFADDATGSGLLTDLRLWWDKLEEKGPSFGYFPNGAKTWLIVKPEVLDAAEDVFAGTEVKITAQGKRHLGAALGTRSFVEGYVTKCVTSWIEELGKLSNIARTHPQAAYSAFVHAIRGKWHYLARTVPDIQDLLLPLEKAVRQVFIPALTGRAAPGDLERELLSLPPRLGGLGLVNPVTTADSEHQASLHLTSALVCLLAQQGSVMDTNRVPRQLAKKDLKRLKQQQEKQRAAELREKLPPTLQRATDLASEKGASAWLTALPLAVHGFDLPKGSFRDALCLRYGWQLHHLPSQCVCGKDFNQDHALSCPTGGLPTIRHNEIRDILATAMSEVCVDVVKEPALQPLSGETFQRSSTSCDPNARLDIRARGFWGSRLDCALFDVRIFNPFAQSNRATSLASVYQRHERAKRNTYEERVREVERASFTPLIFSTSGGASRLTTTFLQHLASLLAEKHRETYSTTMAWLRTTISFSLLRSAIICMRGSRSTTRRVPAETNSMVPGLAISQAHVSPL